MDMLCVLIYKFVCELKARAFVVFLGDVKSYEFIYLDTQL